MEAAAAGEFIQTEGKWDEVLDLQGGAVWFVLSARSWEDPHAD